MLYMWLEFNNGTNEFNTELINKTSMSFATSPYKDSVFNVKRFMFDDIEKTLKLAYDKTVGAPNFLLALGLCCYTEYWGKLLLGVTKKQTRKSGDAFGAFLERLDRAYYGNLMKAHNIYGDIRCGLAHAYLIDGNARIDTGNVGIHGIECDSSTGTYIFWVKAYFSEFTVAVNKYISGLYDGTEDLKKLEDCLKDRPELT